MAAVADPEKLIVKVIAAVSSQPDGVKRLAEAAIKRKLKPYLKDHGLDWGDVEPLLTEIDTFNEIMAAVADPEKLVAKVIAVASSHPDGAKRLAVAVIKRKLQPYLTQHGLDWGDIEPLLSNTTSVVEFFCEPRPATHTFNNFDTIMDAIADPDKLIAQVVTAASAQPEAAKKLAVLVIKSKLQPYLKEHGLQWRNVEPLLKEIISFDEIMAAVADPETLIAKVVSAASAHPEASKKLVVLVIKSKLQPYLKEHGLRWSNVEPLLKEVDSAEELMDAIADPDKLIAMVVSAASAHPEAAKKLVVLVVKSKLQPYLKEHGLRWSNVELLMLEDTNGLSWAIANPKLLLDRAIEREEQRGSNVGSTTTDSVRETRRRKRERTRVVV
jgi:hypothetical protein